MLQLANVTAQLLLRNSLHTAGEIGGLDYSKRHYNYYPHTRLILNSCEKCGLVCNDHEDHSIYIVTHR